MPPANASSISARLIALVEDVRRKEDRLALVLSLVIGALVGLVVVGFILLTGRLAAHAYPPGGSGWRRVHNNLALILLTREVALRHQVRRALSA